MVSKAFSTLRAARLMPRRICFYRVFIRIPRQVPAAIPTARPRQKWLLVHMDMSPFREFV